MEEGGEGTHLEPPAQIASPVSTSPTPVVDESDRRSIAIMDVPVTYPHKMGLQKEARDQYSRDSFYKRVMNAPKPSRTLKLLMNSSV